MTAPRKPASKTAMKSQTPSASFAIDTKSRLRRGPCMSTNEAVDAASGLVTTLRLAASSLPTTISPLISERFPRL
jgi:hypothetical protein